MYNFNIYMAHSHIMGIKNKQGVSPRDETHKKTLGNLNVSFVIIYLIICDANM